ncbi:MAG TPA: hypothetical protein VFE72_04985 [Lysobacter sp.]|nr:hypothetical protein [Lysobacter sp.]
MSADIVPIDPKPALDNVPHMLRRVAAQVEAGELPASAAVVVLVGEGDNTLDVFQLGPDGCRLKLVGAMVLAQQRMLRRTG